MNTVDVTPDWAAIRKATIGHDLGCCCSSCTILSRAAIDVADQINAITRRGNISAAEAVAIDAAKREWRLS
jgi:hypothetical protein